MRSLQTKSLIPYSAIITVCCAVALILGVIITAVSVQAETKTPKNGERLITIHENGKDRGILTKASTLRQAFEEAKIRIDENDLVEPGLDEALVATNYEVNVYRARPVTIVDGPVQQKVMSAHRTARQIVTQAGMSLQDEDETTMDAPSNMVAEGTGVRLSIDRATPFTLVLYGKKVQAYTQGTTVAEMLSEKKITLGEKDRLSVSQDVPITSGMTVELWRDGKQTLTKEEAVAFEVEQIEDADRPEGYRKIKTAGIKGEKTVTYEITTKDGKIVKKRVIQSVVTKKAHKQIEIIGTKVSLPPGSHQDWMSAAGISASDFGYANYIIERESGWNPASANPAGYYGLGQTNLTAISSACPKWRSDPVCQLRFFDGYAQSRYGSWEEAKNFKTRTGWW